MNDRIEDRRLYKYIAIFMAIIMIFHPITVIAATVVGEENTVIVEESVQSIKSGEEFLKIEELRR